MLFQHWWEKTIHFPGLPNHQPKPPQLMLKIRCKYATYMIHMLCVHIYIYVIIYMWLYIYMLHICATNICYICYSIVSASMLLCYQARQEGRHASWICLANSRVGAKTSLSRENIPTWPTQPNSMYVYIKNEYSWNMNKISIPNIRNLYVTYIVYTFHHSLSMIYIDLALSVISHSQKITSQMIFCLVPYTISMVMQHDKIQTPKNRSSSIQLWSLNDHLLLFYVLDLVLLYLDFECVRWTASCAKKSCLLHFL